MPRQFLKDTVGTHFEATLPGFLKAQRWFGGKARTVAGVQVADRIPIPAQDTDIMLLLIDVVYQDGGHETYVLPVASAFGEEAGRILRETPRAVLSRVAADDTDAHQEGVLYDGTSNATAMHRLLRAMPHGAHFPGEAGTLQASSTAAFQDMVPPIEDRAFRMLSAEQSNTSVAFGDHAVLKLYRRLQSGVNPDWEVGRYLTSRAFPYSPAVGGVLEYVRSGETATVGLLQAFVRHKSDAWAAFLNQLDGFLTRVSAESPAVDPDEGKECLLWDLAHLQLSEAGTELIAQALDAATFLGRRTAALHLTLGGATPDPDFAPEPMTLQYRQSRCQSMLESWKQGVRLLRPLSLPGIAIQEEEARLLAQEPSVLGVFRSLLDIEDGGQRIRCHGDYHLGQILWTGSDYIVTDFEGEPARPLHERRLKHSPLYDVAGMLRSFEYASWTALAQWEREESRHELEAWTMYWSRWVRARFLGEYLNHVHHAPFWPKSTKDAARLLMVHQLEKAVYELGYELNNRPGWVAIPLKGINEIVRMSAAQAAA
jgi:trehalose synthase-fused probable maltokinase